MNDDSNAVATLPEEPRPSLLSSFLVIAGFITLIAIVLWGLLHIATLASPWLSDLLKNRNAASIEVTAPGEIMSGENFTISWKHSAKTEGMYTLLYQCKDNVRLETSGESASRVIPCGAAVTVASPENSITVKPVLSGTATTSVSISIVFMPNKPVLSGTATSVADTTSEQAPGNAIVMIYPRTSPIGLPSIQPTQATPPIVRPTTPAVTVLPTQPAPVAPMYAVQTTQLQPRIATPADLSVRVLSVNVDPYGMGVVEFDIANIGGSTAGTYTFEVFLPTQSGYTYSSPTQSPLGPGGHIVNTLRFSQAIGGTVSITVDPSNTVRESNESNNYASQTAMPYSVPQYPYGY